MDSIINGVHELKKVLLNESIDDVHLPLKNFNHRDD